MDGQRVHGRDVLTMATAIGSILIVLLAAGGFVPATWLPDPPSQIIRAIPHLNALMSATAILVIAGGWRAIRRGAIRRHRRAMLTAAGLFLAFLALYLYRLVVLGGPEGFEGDPALYRYVYLPILTVHIGLAIVCIPLLYDAIALGLTVPDQRLPRTRHPRVGRVAATLWMTSFLLGIVVYLLLYWR